MVIYTAFNAYQIFAYRPNIIFKSKSINGLVVTVDVKLFRQFLVEQVSFNVTLVFVEISSRFPVLFFIVFRSIFIRMFMQSKTERVFSTRFPSNQYVRFQLLSKTDLLFIFFSLLLEISCKSTSELNSIGFSRCRDGEIGLQRRSSSG